MRLLHTSDWHLGQTFHGHDRQYEHQCFLDWLLATLEQEQTDALLIAGDIFDNANPSAAALHQFYRFLSTAKARLPGLNVVVIAGNHDSPFRLEAPSPLLAALDVSVVGQVGRSESGEIDWQRLVVPLTDRSGQVRCWCLAVPFLRASDLPKRKSEEQEGDDYNLGVTELYRQAEARAEALREKDQAIIALGHCHLRGGLVSSDSERRILIGGCEALSASIFGSSLAYVGLGHLHRAQTVGDDETRRYSGSPLPLSFNEIDYRHQVLRVDLHGRDVCEVSVLPVPRAVDLIRVPEQTLPEVLSVLESMEWPDLPEHGQPYLEVKVRLNQPEPDLRHQIEAVLRGKPVRLIRIEPRYPTRGSESLDDLATTVEDFGRLEPIDMFTMLYRQKYAADPDASLQAAFHELTHASSLEPSL